MATDPVFASTPRTEVAQASAANTNRDGTGTIVTLAAAGSNGTKVSLIRIVATGTTTAGVVRIYLYDGANVRLLEEILVTAATPSTTVKVFTAEYYPTGLVLESGQEIRVSTHNAETFNVFFYGADI